MALSPAVDRTRSSRYRGALYLETALELRDRKREIRERIWRLLEERGVALFPKPIYGRIPNFLGREIAAARLARHPIFERARVVFCNPDSPQRPVREAAIRYRKILVMATPRLREGFLIIEPGDVPRGREREASTIRGAFRYGRKVEELPLPIDLKITGSVAVSPDGGRVGKGGGYSDLEWGILREMGAVRDDTPVATTVHDLQVVEEIPMAPHDMPVDYIFTPTREIRVEPPRPKPPGILPEELDERKASEIPMLAKLLAEKRRAK